MMNIVDHFARTCSVRLLSTAPMERLRATRTALRSTGEPWLWQVLGLILAGIAAVGLIWLLLTRRRRKQLLWADFRKQADDRGLDSDERRLLKAILAHTDLKSFSTIFTLEAAFDYGAVRHRCSAAPAKMSAQERDAVLESIDDLRDKMEFQNSTARALSGMSSRDISEGTRLSVIRDDDDTVEAVVIGANAVGMSVQPMEAVRWEAGDTLHIQFTQDEEILEFQTTVLQMRDGKVSLNHSDKVRPANRRRFPHVPVQFPARIAYMPFRKTDPKLAALFHKASLVEMAGPGLKILSPILLHADQRVLVELYLRDKYVVQSVGRIMRVEPSDEAKCLAAIELVALTDAEMAELVTEANAGAVARPRRAAKPLKRDQRQPVA